MLLIPSKNEIGLTPTRFACLCSVLHERLEVVHHCAGGDVFACGFLQNFPPVFGPTFFKDVIQPCADLFVVGVITRLRWSMENLARDVVVQLELEHGRKRIVVVIRRIVVDVRLRSRIAMDREQTAICDYHL